MQLLAGASQEAVLVAPFMKRATVARLLDALPPSVSLRCLTRWLPQEVASGVSDLEVLDLVLERGGELYLRSDLHAKYYRIDRVVQAGSANLTGRALGWVVPANFELMIGVGADEPQLEGFEVAAFSGAILATFEIQQQVAALAKEIAPLVTAELESSEDETSFATDDRPWFPQTRSPESLYNLYATGSERGTAAGIAQAQLDLEWLSLPPGLDEQQFRAAVALILAQTPLMAAVNAFLSQPRRFGEGRVFLERYLKTDAAPAERSWQTLLRWLSVFMPHRYEVARPRHTEILRRTDL